MTKDMWINLPVKDVAKSRAFFAALGFTFNDKHGIDPTCMLIGTKKVVVMLFSEEMFKGFTRIGLSDTRQSSEVLFSIDAESREEVDELAHKAKEAGGNVFAQPGESQGWLYGCGFADLDGHRWNVLYMDMAKMPGISK
jgi:hypothetical protein